MPDQTVSRSDTPPLQPISFQVDEVEDAVTRSPMKETVLDGETLQVSVQRNNSLRRRANSAILLSSLVHDSVWQHVPHVTESSHLTFETPLSRTMTRAPSPLHAGEVQRLAPRLQPRRTIYLQCGVLSENPDETLPCIWRASAGSRTCSVVRIRALPSTTPILDQSDDEESSDSLLFNHSFTDLTTTNASHLPKRIGRYALTGKVLGTGSFGAVYAGLCLESPHQSVALKRYSNAATGIRRRSALREIGLLKRLRHPCIVNQLDAYTIDSDVWMVLRQCDGGELYDFVASFERGVPDRIASGIALQLVQAVHYLHLQQVCHHDIKLENVLLVHPPRPESIPQVQLADFSLARPIQGKSTVRCGSEEYAAPEMLLYGAYDPKQADVWSLGVVIYALLAGGLPFEGDARKPHLLRHRICHAMVPPLPTKSKGGAVTETAADLVRRVLKVSPLVRLTIPDMLRHPWLLNAEPAA